MSEIERRQLIRGISTIVSTKVLADSLTSREQTDAIFSQGEFTGKVVSILGATSGIGKTTAEIFAKKGAKVFFCGRRQNLGAEVERNIRAFGGEATYMYADVRKAETVKAFIDGCIAKYDRLDIAFNNAGIDYPSKLTADTSIEEFDDLMNTNARGVFLGMKYEIPYILKTGGGIIINTASIGGIRAFPNIIGYSASKAAVIHMSKVAAQEYGKTIRINCISPGTIDTPMLDRYKQNANITEEQIASPYPSKRIGTAEEVANLVLWLASDAASYISGGNYSIDGGGLG
jgi:NAD(P)-dependent dehydrogenase (short-subunit alcohol dehydrogenase family)